jgi:hypothetical protein
MLMVLELTVSTRVQVTDMEHTGPIQVQELVLEVFSRA